MNARIVNNLDAPLKFTVRNDYAFKQVFGTEKNKDILVAFVSLVTGMKAVDFDDVRIENTELATQFYDEKTGRLDIKLRLKTGEKINIEMQNIWFEDFTKRSIFYWAQLLTEDFTKGADYWELHKCIAINIVNQPVSHTDTVHSIYKILETERHTELDSILEIHFLDLTKIPKENRNTLEKWLLFIQTDEQEVRKMLAQENPLLEKAQETMNRFYSVAEQRALYQAAWRYESDRVSMISAATRKGYAQGIEEAQRRYESDRVSMISAATRKGYDEGLNAGKTEGFSAGVRETALAFKRLGIDSAKIAEATGLSEEEIAQL